MRRLLVAAALGLPLLVLAAYQAFFDPNVEFLRPSLSAEWIVHPRPGATGFSSADYRSPDVVFRRSFDLEEPPGSLPVRVTSPGVTSIEINGRKAAPPAGGEGRNWKCGRELDLGPFLRRGSNEIGVRVSYRNGPPALLLEAGGELGGILVSDGRWRVARGDGRGGLVPAAVILRDEAFLADKENFLRRSPYRPLYGAVLGLLVLFIAYALLPVRFKPWLARETGPARPSAFLGGYGLPATAFALVAVTQLRNAVLLRWQDGLPDAQSHLGYVLYVLETWRVPLPTDAWQAYHPPLFYFLAASLGAAAEALGLGSSIPKSIQLLDAILGLSNVLLAWLLVKKLLPDQVSARNLGFSVAAFLPVGFYVNPNITNEVLSGSLVGLAVYLACAGLFGKSQSWKRAIGIGFVCGLCLLSKYTGLFVFASVASLLTLRALSGADRAARLAAVRQLALFVAVVLLISGWIYVRNFVHYGDPFVGNWDRASGFHYEQPPGYRSASFYAHFGSFLWHVPERARWSGFWEGIYASLWMDVPGYLVGSADRARDSLGSAILWLALLPGVGIAVGFARACWHLLRREWDHPFFIVVTTSFWTLASVILFSLQVPYFSTVKAVFLLSLIPAVAVFAGLGLELLCRQLGRLRFVLYADLAALYGAILYLFAIR